MKRKTVLRNLLRIVLSAAILVAMLAYLQGTFHKKIAPGKHEAQKPLLEGRPTDVVHRVIQTESIEVVGTLRAERRTEVSARMMAAIVAMDVKAGERAEQGQVLARLDDRDLRARLEQARQGERGAQAETERLQKEYARHQQLLEQKVVSRQEFESVESAYKVAQAQLQQAREERTGAETMLSYAVILSPVSGVVIDKLAEVGDTATPGKPLFTIYDPSALRLEAAVPEGLATGLQVGDVLEMRIATANDSEKPTTGTLQEIVPQADAASRSVLIKVRVPVSLEGLFEGGFGRVMIPGRERIRLCLALSAVQEIGQLRFVDVVKKDNSLEKRQVRLGEHSRFGRVEVLSGLDADERVVLYGPPPAPLPPGAILFPKQVAP